MTKRTILLIEDEEAISEPLAAALGREGFDRWSPRRSLKASSSSRPERSTSSSWT